MTKTGMLSELDMLADVINPAEGDLTPSVAKSVLQWKFSDRAINRMNKLARKNTTGTLTPNERKELDNFMRVGSLVDLLQAKARLSMKRRHSA